MDHRPIGVMDSGAGGLTVARVLKKRLPKERIVYIGDTARNPYGERPKEEIIRFAGEMKDFLLRKKVKMVIIACNTITFNVPPSFYEGTIPVVGMSLDFSALPHGKKAAVFATPASIATHRHGDAVRRLRPEAAVTEVPCYGLAHAIETGASEKEEEAIISGLLAKYGGGDAEEAVFGCTHYPLAEVAFHHLMPKTFFLDPAEPTVSEAERILKEKDLLSDEEGEDLFYFTADDGAAAPLTKAAMGKAYPIHITSLKEE